MGIGQDRKQPGRCFGRCVHHSIWIFTALIMLLAQPALAAPSASIAVDGYTGKTVYARNADKRRYPASLTKIMTLYILFEELKAGRIKMDTRFRVSKYASGRPPSKLGLRAGTTIRVKDALLALVTKSANDAATVIAENLGGTESAFARRMTKTAHRLGMKRTQFRNASGLPNRAQVTTARDMARLGIRIQRDFPRYYKFFRTSSFRYRGRTYRTHNRLLGRYRGTDGIKTGYTRASGFNLVSSVRRGKKHVVAVVIGGRTGRARNRKMVHLLNRAFPRVAAYKRPKRVRVARKTPVKPIPIPALKPPAPQKAQQKPVIAALNAGAGSNIVPASAPAIDREEKDLLRPMIGDGPSVFASAHPLNLSSLPPLRAGQSEFDPNNDVKTETPKKNTDRILAANTIEPAAPTKAKIRKVPLKPTVLPAKAVDQLNLRGNNQPPGWTIQVGAFVRKGDAQQRLDAVKNKAKRALRGRAPFTIAFAKNDKIVYRARFGGFTKTTALNTCRLLKRRAIGCFTLAP